MTTPLPPLPDGKLVAEEFICGAPAYTAEQMTEYGRACARAALERAAKECDQYSESAWNAFKTGLSPARGNPWVEGRSDGADECAELIRTLAKEYGNE